MSNKKNSKNRPTTSGAVSVTCKKIKSLTAQGYMAACAGGTVEFTIGVFFDGTGNNRFNAKKKINSIKSSETSYRNDFSNIARSWEYYTGKFNGKDFQGLNIYVEGSGTKKGAPDDNAGLGFGQGPTGIIARAKEGSELVVKDIEYTVLNGLRKKSQITAIKITFDVFGFSRGAATARNFVHINSTRDIKPITEIDQEGGKKLNELEIEYDNYLHYLINKEFNNKQKIELEITWRFAGLYETVSSVGIDGFIDFGDDTEKLGLKTITRKVDKIVHFVALDEYRYNFSLTETGGSSKVINFPGVHSDIGGGYLEISDEIDYELYKASGVLGDSNEIEQVRDRFLDEGWYKRDHLKIKGTTLNEFRQDYELLASRKGISNKYSYIPLRIMTNEAIKAGVNFNKVGIESKYSFGDSLLYKVFKSFDGKSLNISDSDLKKLRYRYLHWSSVYNLKVVDNFFDLPSDKPRLDNNNAWYKREVF